MTEQQKPPSQPIKLIPASESPFRTFTASEWVEEARKSREALKRMQQAAAAEQQNKTTGS